MEQFNFSFKVDALCFYKKKFLIFFTKTYTYHPSISPPDKINLRNVFKKHSDFFKKVGQKVLVRNTSKLPENGTLEINFFSKNIRDKKLGGLMFYMKIGSWTIWGRLTFVQICRMNRFCPPCKQNAGFRILKN